MFRNKKATLLGGRCSKPDRIRDSFCILPHGKINVRRHQAVGGNARPRCNLSFESPILCLKNPGRICGRDFGRG